MNNREENLPPIPPIKAQLPPIPTQTADKQEAPSSDSESQEAAGKAGVDNEVAENDAASNNAAGNATAGNDATDNDAAEDNAAEDNAADSVSVTFETGEEKDGDVMAGSERSEDEKQTEPDLSHFDGQPICNEGMFTRLFSFKGRITRLEYLLSFLAFEIAFTIHTLVQQVETTAGGTGCFAKAVM